MTRHRTSETNDTTQRGSSRTLLRTHTRNCQRPNTRQPQHAVDAFSPPAAAHFITKHSHFSHYAHTHALIIARPCLFAGPATSS